MKKYVFRSSKKLTRPQKMNMHRIKNAIFLTGGIGDTFAVESFLSDEERTKITTIYYATNKSKEIEELWRKLPNYPNLRHHITVWDDFSKFWCFYSMNGYITYCKKNKIKLQISLTHTTDLSISIMFGKINRKDIAYNNSSFINHSLTNYDNLPQEYVVICPYSNDKRTSGRDFSLNDWKECLNFLETNNKKGVVLNKGNEISPIHEKLIDLNNKTTIVEAVEILKKSNGYIGIDSALSVLATKLNLPLLKIKSNNSHLYNNLRCYYSPLSDFYFVNDSIRF